MALYTLIYGARVDGGPEPKILDVYLSHVRKFLKATGLPFEIETLYAEGFRLVDKKEET